MTVDSDQHLPPNTPEAFESLCLDLWTVIWKDPNAQKNGRRGQSDAGVDVFGKHEGHQMGVQCKQKNGLLHTKVKVKDLEDEVEKAKKFKPPLHTFILATSGPTDEKVQRRARNLAKASDPPFEVSVWSWDKIWHEIYRRKKLLRLFLDNYKPNTGKTPQRIAPTRLTHTVDQLFGRSSELARLDAAWDDPKVNVVSIVAWGGVGKTCLVGSWAAGLAARDFDGADYFDGSFYSQGTRDMGSASADVFINQALIFFGDEAMAASPASPWDKGSRLAELVARRRTLLVLDGLEPLQYPPGPLEGELKDPGIAALLKGLAARNTGLCVVTSRVEVVDLKPYRGGTAPEWDLERLSTRAGVALLASLGVHGAAPEIEELVHDVDGHALTLNLLGRYLHRAHRGDVRRRDRVKLSKADRDIQGGHAFKAMEAYATWLAAGGEQGRRQLAVLRLLGLFDRPAAADCLASLRHEPVLAGLTEPLAELDEDDWNLTLSTLQDAKLVARSPDGSVDAHPLIREYFAQQMQQQTVDGWRQAHGRLFDHLQESTEHQPDTLEGLQPLYQAVVHGCLAGREQEACHKVYVERILRGQEYFSGKKLGAIGADLGAVVCFFESPWRRPSPFLRDADQAWLLNEAAFRLRALGRLTEAVEPVQASLKMCIHLEDWKEAAIRAGNLSELQLTLGDIQEAVGDAEQAVYLADCSGDAFQRMARRTTLADALFQAGQPDAALARFREAEQMQAEWQPTCPLLYSLRGFQYCDLQLAEAERAAWRAGSYGGELAVVEGRGEAQTVEACRGVKKRAAQTLRWMTENRMALLNIALAHLTLGRARFYRAILQCLDPSDATSEIEEAVDGLRRAGTLDHLPRGLLTRAWLRARTRDLDGARTDLAEAWDIAERGSMKLFQADVLLHRARLFEDRQALAEARVLIEKHGYGRRLGELEDAEGWLGMTISRPHP